ncbi:MAG: acyltransferase [Alistipes sp.]|nr:acyltransferase [Alistipes sp.]
MLTETRFKANGTSRRMPELDALRGLAALAVIFFHFSLTLPREATERGFWELMLFQAGAERVTFFFVLSGFVLTLSVLHRQTLVDYKAYFVRRFMRIYPLYLLATLFVFGVKSYFFQGDVSTDYVTPYYNIGWRLPVSWGELLNTLTLIGDYNTWALVGPAWTLMFEMRISVLLPLIVLLFNLRPLWSLVGCVVLGGLCAYGNAQIPVIDGFYAVDQTLSTTFSNGVFLAVFAAGMFMAYRQQQLFAYYRGLSHMGRIVWFGVGVLCYMNAVWLPLPAIAVAGFLHQMVTVFGVILVMVFAVNNMLASRLLTLPFFQFFGRISYGLYLWHFPLLYLFVALLQPYMSLNMVFLITVATVVPLSWLTYHYVEAPFIRQGHHLTERIKARATTSRVESV